jgi:hypothetical protein
LGLGDSVNVNTFTVLTAFNKLNITRIVCGGYACLFLSSNQEWYGTGFNYNNKKGQMVNHIIKNRIWMPWNRN